jgi:hypothetical protein
MLWLIYIVYHMVDISNIDHNTILRIFDMQSSDLNKICVLS